MADKDTKDTSSNASAAKEKVLDAGAGAPNAMREAAEALPEKDNVQKAYKKQLLADTTEAETAAKVEIVKASPDADETPSGAALLAVAGESDPIKQGEDYQRKKAAVRRGTAEDAK
jgi:hypothetical protein